MKLSVRGIPSEQAASIRRGRVDANGQPAVTRVAEGVANPCRHCLELILEGDDKLVLAYRPFDAPHPYAEIGPIFLHKTPCVRYDRDSLPTWFDYMDTAIIRGYGHDDWIRYDTGEVVPGVELSAECRKILNDETVEYVHIRSKFNCFQCRVDRG